MTKCHQPLCRGYGGDNLSSKIGIKERVSSRVYLSKELIVAGGTYLRQRLRGARWSTGSRHLPLMARLQILLPAKFLERDQRP
jgi:hypothetical protein